MSTNTVTVESAQLEGGPLARHLQQFARNAFRLLGLPADATQQEVHEAAARVRRAHKLGVELSTPLDAGWLGRPARAESDLRDALGRLSEPARRARERLFWFHAREHVPEVSTLKDADAFVSTSPVSEFSPAQHHDAALLLLAAVLRFDAGLRHPEAWERALTLWKELVARDDFWSLLVAADLKGDYEQLVTHGEVSLLRRDALRAATAPVVELARDAVTREDRPTARAALSVLRRANLSPELQAEYENEILAPLEEQLEQLCDEAYAESFKLNIFATGGNPGARMCDAALAKFHETARPALFDFLQLAGADGPVSRRVFSHASAILNSIAEGYRIREFMPMAVRTARKAWMLAPPASHALLLVEEKLKALGAPPAEKTEEDYEEQLKRELRPQPRLFAAYGDAPPEENLLDVLDKYGPTGRRRSRLNKFAVGVLLLFCFVAGWLMSSRGGGRRRVNLPPPMLSDTPFRLSIPPSTANMDEVREQLERIQRDMDRFERRIKPAPTPRQRRQRRRTPTNNNSR